MHMEIEALFIIVKTTKLEITKRPNKQENSLQVTVQAAELTDEVNLYTATMEDAHNIWLSKKTGIVELCKYYDLAFA